MNVHIFIEEVEEPGAHTTFDMSEDQAKVLRILPFIEKLRIFLDHHEDRVNKALMKQTPWFNKFSPEKQTAILKEFREKFTLWDLENPSPDRPAPPMIIVP
ncbi:MAG: hypothetical protein JWO03_899 [Bacteroidetes bacterium]|nr:hypothetical protein [Bacteroidota bacterium]